MNTLKQNRLIVYFTLSVSVLVATCLGGCVTTQRIDPSASGRYDGFIRDDEIQEHKFVPIDELIEHVRIHGGEYTPWFKLALPGVLEYL